ncbi:MAG: MOSC domain-containing protein [Gaiellales bacterium]
MAVGRDSPVLVGRVVALWRYPVKSLAGEAVRELAVDERGVAADRVWGLVDRGGKIASGKTTRRFRRVPGLLVHGARLGPGGVPRLHLADGRVVALSDEIAAELAGPGWRFERENSVSHLDAGPVHLVTTATLASLGAAAGEPVEPERLRPNLVIDAGAQREEDWAGHPLFAGEVELAVSHPAERCVMVGHAQSGMAHRPYLLKTIGRWNQLCAGMYANVVVPGSIRVGDEVSTR